MAQEDLYRLERLQRPNCAGDGAQNATVATVYNRLWRRRLREDAPVTGTVVVVEDRQLTLPLDGTARHQRLFIQDTRIVYQIPGRHIVRAIDDHVVRPHYSVGVPAGQLLVVRVHDDVLVQLQ